MLCNKECNEIKIGKKQCKRNPTSRPIMTPSFLSLLVSNRPEYSDSKAMNTPGASGRRMHAMGQAVSRTQRPHMGVRENRDDANRDKI